MRAWKRGSGGGGGVAVNGYTYILQITDSVDLAWQVSGGVVVVSGTNNIQISLPTGPPAVGWYVDVYLANEITPGQVTMFAGLQVLASEVGSVNSAPNLTSGLGSRFCWTGAAWYTIHSARGILNDWGYPT